MKRTNIDSIANEILQSIDNEEPTAVPNDDPVQLATLAIGRAKDAGGGAVRQAYLAEAQKHISRIDPVPPRAALQNLQGHISALQGRGRDTKVAHVTRL